MITKTQDFTPPARNEKWRFSGLKNISVSGYTDALDANSFKASPEVRLVSGQALSPADRAALGAAFTDFGTRAIQQLTTCPQAYGVKIDLPTGQTGEAHTYAATLDDKSFFKGCTLATAGANSYLTLTQNISSQRHSNLYATSTRLVAQAHARLTYILVQDAPLDAHNFNFIEVNAAEGAQVDLIILNLGSAYTRQEVTAIISGRNAQVNLRSLTLGLQTQEIDQRTLQVHQAPSAKSDLLFKNVLADQARTIFSGLIQVAPGAQKTDAYQKNRNLILSDAAQANSLPGLEIEANDVRCTHGSTVGRLSAEELFYLRARGIDERAARALLVGGYCAEILSGLPEDLSNWASARVAERLG